jgi:small ubiquitin-related modifier
VKPKTEDGVAHINLTVKNQDGSEMHFKIKRNTKLDKLMNVYCQRQSIARTAIRFLFDGQQIQPDQTPDELHMEDGDAIDAMMHQVGGCM